MVNLTYETLHQNNSPFSKPTETDLIRQALGGYRSECPPPLPPKEKQKQKKTSWAVKLWNPAVILLLDEW